METPAFAVGNDLAVVGDWLVYLTPDGRVASTVRAVPIGGGTPVTLVPRAHGPALANGPGGTAVVISEDSDGRALRRITADGAARPEAAVARELPRPAAAISGLALAQGRLLTADASSGDWHPYVREVTARPSGGAPEVGGRSRFLRDGSPTPNGHCSVRDVGCRQLHGLTDGRIAWVSRGEGTGDRFRANGPGRTDFFEHRVPDGGALTDTSGAYVIYTADREQHVYRLGNHADPVVKRAPGAAALWGDVLWTAGRAPGAIDAYDLTARKPAPGLTTDAPCSPDELQAVGRFLYWSCGADGPAGVFDRTRNKSVAVPAGEALLGDGHVVTHDKEAGKLRLTSVTGGTAVTRPLGDLPDTGASQRHVRWTVDRTGGLAAYVDARERVHVVTTGGPAQPLGLLAPADSAERLYATKADATPQTLTEVLPSRPVADWELTVRDKATGTVVHTGRGGPARGRLSVGWHGTDDRAPGSRYLPNGAYGWTLSLRPATGPREPLTVTGTVGLRHGQPVRHDHTGPGLPADPDGTGDLLTLNASGTLTFHTGNGRGGLSGKVPGPGWPAKTLAVPVGDLDKDRCNDVLVRMPNGSLRAYLPACGQPLTPSTRHTALGTGWNAYDVLTSPGDLTGDGRADLLARKASTGDVHVFAATANGGLAPGRKIRSSWSSYSGLVGAGDLNGDGVGDVLAVHRNGTLYRYDGRGDGTLKDRVRLSSAWGAYDAVVGAGDLTSDGRADLVARHTSGALYRFDGRGDGTFTTRTKIADRWGAYQRLS
ncbi:FG-GAP repeat domain-containing protein [Streptomyces sp. G45]|uniref:FG-GAP repeat domain-containing protein n=1 Tax=Streptomyces sp. G45 TaxID=3406627 RepID=UPI003C21D61F